MDSSWQGQKLIDSLQTLGVIKPEIKPSRRKVLDFFVAPAQASAKIQNENGGLTRIELMMTAFSKAQWAQLVSIFAQHAFCLASFLSDNLPQEIEVLLNNSQLSLFPSHKKDLQISVTGGDKAVAEVMKTTFCQHLVQYLNQNPFAIFLLRGKGKEELLFDVEQERRQLREMLAVTRRAPLSRTSQSQQQETSSPKVAAKLLEEANPVELSAMVTDMKFNLRADELPAALLKRLDSPPLGGLEADLDYILEAAYNQITRRSQSYGLSMVSIARSE